MNIILDNIKLDTHETIILSRLPILDFNDICDPTMIKFETLKIKGKCIQKNSSSIRLSIANNFSLTSVDLSEMDTSNIGCMIGLFFSCMSLRRANLEGIDVSNITSMKELFDCCSHLEEVILHGLDTSNVESMEGMFRYCFKMKELDLSYLSTSKVKNMSYMFTGCTNITELDLSNFNADKLVDASAMFYGCHNLKYIDMSGMKLKSIATDDMFGRCWALKEIKIADDATTRQIITEALDKSGVHCNIIT